MGITIAFETRYEVRTHVTSSRPALKLPWMWLRETFTTVMSMISMKVGTMTVRVTNHLLGEPVRFMAKGFQAPKKSVRPSRKGPGQ